MSNFGAIAGLIGILAFVLAVPMSILANMLTPRIQIWWAGTSNARRDRRIDKLRERLADYNSLPEHWADALLKLVRLGLLFVMAVCMVVACFLTDLHVHLHRIEHALGLIPALTNWPWENKQILKGVAIIFSFAAGVFASFFILEVRDLSPAFILKQRQRINDDILSLTTKVGISPGP